MIRRFHFRIGIVFAVLLALFLTQTVQAQQARSRHVHGRTSKSTAYPNPKSVRVPQQQFHGKAAGPVNQDRYSKIPEKEVLRRMQEEECLKNCYGIEGLPCEKCPLCEEDPTTPCGTCKMCKAGFPCEKTLCRHCVQQRSQNMCNSCDLSAGDEPCGTCDACREHRSDPCEHADDGHGPRGEFNPYKEPRFMSVIPRPILDAHNNGARKFPVYYNPGPYYRPHWNPSLHLGYARPFTFRWSCPLCYKDPCDCDKPGFAGQVPYAYACKFCNRNPCACTQDICNVNKEMNPKGISSSLNADRMTSTKIQDRHIRDAAAKKDVAPLTDAPERETQLKDLLDETSPDNRKPPVLNTPDSEENDSTDGEEPTPLRDAAGIRFGVPKIRK